jgi:hypothetical protein
MVLKIRELRPDVIITNHDTTSGHGHHQATGRLIIEAFDAAADPKRFPEQLSRVKPWQAKRLFVRIFGGATSQQPDRKEGSEKIVSIDPNEVDPVRETSFAEQALDALQQHATQGPWPKSMAELLKTRRIEAGKLPLIRYRLMREAAGAPALPENATTPLAGLQLPEQFAAGVAPPNIAGRALTDFIDQPDRVLGTLIDWRAGHTAADSAAEDLDRFRLFEARLDRALAIASGVTLTLSSPAAVVVPGLKTTFTINLTNSGLGSVQVAELRLHSWGESAQLKTADELLPNTDTIVPVERITPKGATLTVPKEEHLYDNLFLGQRFEAVAKVEIDGAKFSVSAGILRDVAPAVEIKSISPSPYVWTSATLNQPLSFKVLLTNNLDAPFNGNLTIGNPQQHIFEAGRKLSLAPLETSEVILKSSAIPLDTVGPRRLRSNSGLLSLSVEPQDARNPITQHSIRVNYSDARVARGLRVGFVPSFDQTLQRSLAALGVAAKELTVADIQNADLSTYSTIIIDNRGYEAHPELVAANSHLLEFVNAGGTLLVFYHKSNEWNPDANKKRQQLAPYPIVLGDERVTDETAPIKFLLPRHPLLNIPNRITQADFANWIQERGLYYPKDWDAHYSAIFSTNDPGEAPLNGGLLVGQYGKGNYIYTSMVWYRELRAGVPGAYRMFANMISYGHR